MQKLNTTKEYIENISKTQAQVRLNVRVLNEKEKRKNMRISCRFILCSVRVAATGCKQQQVQQLHAKGVPPTDP